MELIKHFKDKIKQQNLRMELTTTIKYFALLLICFFHFAISSRSVSTCPRPWYTLGKSCYLFTRSPKLTWLEANQFCENFGANLVSVHTISEHYLIVEVLKDIDPVHEKWFTSGSQTYKPGVFTWKDGSNIFNERPITLDTKLITDSGLYVAYNFSRPENRWGLTTIRELEKAIDCFRLHHCINKMSAIYFVSFLVIISIKGIQSADFSVCQAECVYVNITTGAINLPAESGENCCWILQPEPRAKDRVEAFLFLQTIEFESGDYLTIFSINDKDETKLIVNITDSVSNNLFFTGTKNRLIFQLITSAVNSSTRSFHLFLEMKDNKAPIPILGDIGLKLLPVAGKPDVLTTEWTLNFALQTSQSNKKLAASVYEISAGIFVKFDTIWAQNSHDYLSSNNTIEITLFIQNISSAGNTLVISIYSVDGACSSYVSLTDKEPKTTVAVKSEDLTENLINVKCIWIIQSDNPKNWLNINFDSKEPIDVQAGNSFVVRKGNRKSSPVMFVISSTNFADIRTNIYNSIFDSSSLYITYEAFETNGKHPHFDVLRPVVNNYIVGGQKLDFSIPNMPTKFLFKANANLNAVLSAAPGQKFANNTYIYDSPIMSSDKLLAVFKADDVCPDSLWSNSDLLVLDFKELPSKMIIELKSEPANLGSTARQSKGNLVLFSNQLDCKSAYNWFIPPKPTDSNQEHQMVKSLVISNLALEKGGSMSIKSYAYGGTHEFTITGENAMSLPTFYLDANISHSIIYQRADVCDKNSITLIQASIDTISYDACANIEVTAKQNFVSCDYPNNYPLTEWTMTKNCRHMNSTSSNIYISFNDVDLVDNHSLEFLGSTGTVNLTKSNIPGDTIVSNKVAINFNRVFNSDAKTVRTLGERLSGRGFNATLEPIECGGVSMNKSGLLNINGTDKPKNAF
uniref:C-type lectin domain-containing protein n=1 Tax=Tetranychus urticae TaxID=32264 RepID=T1KT74_TETUR